MAEREDEDGEATRAFCIDAVGLSLGPSIYDVCTEGGKGGSGKADKVREVA